MQSLTLFPKEVLQKMCQEYLNLSATHYACGVTTDNPGIELPPCLTIITIPNPRQPQTWHIEHQIIPLNENHVTHLRTIDQAYAHNHKYVFAVFLTCEIWVAKGDIKQPPILPSQHPDRTEHVICWAHTLEKNAFALRTPILRDADGNPSLDPSNVHVMPTHSCQLTTAFLDRYVQAMQPNVRLN